MHFERYGNISPDRRGILRAACGIELQKDDIDFIETDVTCAACLKIIEYRNQLQSLGRKS